MDSLQFAKEPPPHEGVRALGLLLLLIGVLALAAPTLRNALPFLSDIDDARLRILGGCCLALGAIAVWLNRGESE